MDRRPGVRGRDLRRALAANKPLQAFPRADGFHVVGARSAERTLLVIRGLQADTRLERRADPSQGLEVPQRRMHGQSPGMDLVDRHMDVQVIGVRVHGTDALILAESECLDDPVFDRHKRRRIGSSPGGNDSSR